MVSIKEFLRIELEMGISLDNPNFVNLANNTAEQLKGLGHSLLDYGAGTGVYADAFHRSGFDVFIWEKFDAHKEYIRERLPHLNIIDKPITTDIMAFIEVAEHMTDKELNALFKKIKPTYILFSSTSQKTDNDEAWGHINVKEQSEWDAFFEGFGYKVEKQLSIPTSWAKLYKYGKGN
jgi:2-polyprenyl-3-methyl-5-hydroxy-6-metoxy-1,4-benzoquinol methylase